MDMLGSEQSSLAILEHYNKMKENDLVVDAIENATSKPSTEERCVQASRMINF